MLQAAFGGALVFGPLLFQVRKCPLAAAECKVLDARHLQIVISIHHTLPVSIRSGYRK